MAKVYRPRRERWGKRHCAGSVLLAEKMLAEGLTLDAGASELGCSKAQLSKWALGDACPCLHWAMRLRDRFGVALEQWMQPAPKAE